jgi:hypothetical protein
MLRPRLHESARQRATPPGADCAWLRRPGGRRGHRAPPPGGDRSGACTRLRGPRGREARRDRDGGGAHRSPRVCAGFEERFPAGGSFAPRGPAIRAARVCVGAAGSVCGRAGCRSGSVRDQHQSARSGAREGAPSPVGSRNTRTSTRLRRFRGADRADRLRAPPGPAVRAARGCAVPEGGGAGPGGRALGPVRDLPARGPAPGESRWGTPGRRGARPAGVHGSACSASSPRGPPRV